MSLRVWIAPIGSRRVGDNRRIELLTKLTAQLRDAAFGVFRELLGSRAVLNPINGLAGVVFEILEQAVELFLHLADSVALFTSTFRCQPRLLPLNFSLALLQL